MFCLNIALGNVAWRLLFKNADSAKLAKDLIQAEGKIYITDDFGQEFSAQANSIHGFMLEDLDKTKLAHCEMFLHQKRIEVTAVKLAQSDPGLRAAQSNQGPAIVTPFPANGGRPF